MRAWSVEPANGMDRTEIITTLSLNKYRTRGESETKILGFRGTSVISLVSSGSVTCGYRMLEMREKFTRYFNAY